MAALPAAEAGPVRLADYPASAVYGPRPMIDYEFVWLLRGSAVWTITENVGPQAGSTHQHLLRPGVLALARAGTTDCYRWDPTGPSTHAYVHFRLTDGPVPDHRHPDTDDGSACPAVQNLTRLPVLDGCCRYLLALAADPSPQAATRRAGLVALMLDVFLHGPVPATGPELPDIMVTVADRIRADWDVHGIRPIAVETLAAGVGVSAGHLHRLFRTHLGLGPGHALELIRLSRAAEALLRSNAGIAEIAELTGFANPYHFSRRFRRAYGSPPGSYRQDEHRLDPLAPLPQPQLLALSYRLG